ncbi:MAG TPA: glycerophosphodiester phosphodiesterase [Acidimicrobiales bacterium]|nr:glycerophosphodiester phosphodiesterase [Acidimicrobiales bacterium]
MTTAPAVWAHRGASAAFRENTLDAFAGAIALGADGIELDVRRTADGALAVHHDVALADGRPIVRLRADELPAFVPFLDAALDACAGVMVNIEIKNVPVEADYDPDESVAAGVAQLVAERNLHESVIVSSFSLSAIDAVRAADDRIPTAWLTLPNYDQISACELVVERGHSALHPEHPGVTASVVDAARRHGIALNTWTVDDPAEMARLAALGVDAIVTNVPDVALKTFWGNA